MQQPKGQQGVILPYLPYLPYHDVKELLHANQKLNKKQACERVSLLQSTQSILPYLKIPVYKDFWTLNS